MFLLAGIQRIDFGRNRLCLKAVSSFCGNLSISLLSCSQIIAFREISKHPDDDGANENCSRHLLKILASLFPGMPPYCLARRNAVRRQFHNERQVIVLDEFAHHHSGNDSQHDTCQIDAQQCQRCIVWEERPRNQYEYRKPACARHKRQDRNGDKPALAALDGACRHYRRDIAPESHYHRYE